MHSLAETRDTLCDTPHSFASDSRRITRAAAGDSDTHSAKRSPSLRRRASSSRRRRRWWSSVSLRYAYTRCARAAAHGCGSIVETNLVLCTDRARRSKERGGRAKKGSGRTYMYVRVRTGFLHCHVVKAVRVPSLLECRRVWRLERAAAVHHPRPLLARMASLVLKDDAGTPRARSCRPLPA